MNNINFRSLTKPYDTDYLKKWVVIMIPFTALLTLFVLPLVIMLTYSFSSEFPPGSITLSNYTDALTGIYMSVLVDTFIITIKTTIGVILAGFALAYSLVRFTKRTSFFLILIILPFWTNYIVRMYAWINIFQSGGALSWTLDVLPIVQGDFSLLYTETAVIIGLAYIWLPLAVFPIYASIANIDQELIYAAKDLGAGPIKTFFTITLPLSINGVFAAVILVGIPIFGSFITPELLGGTDSVMIGNIIDQQFSSSFNWHFGSALAMLVTFFMIALLVVGQYMNVDILSQGDSE